MGFKDGCKRRSKKWVLRMGVKECARNGFNDGCERRCKQWGLRMGVKRAAEDECEMRCEVVIKDGRKGCVKEVVNELLGV